jgi:hypothetical protein
MVQRMGSFAGLRFLWGKIIILHPTSLGIADAME